MKTIRRIIARNFTFTLYLVVGLALWFVGSATIGEHYATAVGPDFLLKLPIALVKLAAIGWVSRWFIKDRFPTIDAFTRKGDKPESEFARIWKLSGDAPDQRLDLAVRVHLGVPLIIALIVLFAL
jgi:hypothetical protein